MCLHLGKGAAGTPTEALPSLSLPAEYCCCPPRPQAAALHQISLWPTQAQSTYSPPAAGDYKSGKRHGFGVYSFPNGDQFLGQCASDMPHGYGTYVYATGQVYEGQWLHGRKHGWCLYTVEAEEVWAGEGVFVK